MLHVVLPFIKKYQALRQPRAMATAMAANGSSSPKPMAVASKAGSSL
jgi:hypothetical protein